MTIEELKAQREEAKKAKDIAIQHLQFFYDESLAPWITTYGGNIKYSKIDVYCSNGVEIFYDAEICFKGCTTDVSYSPDMTISIVNGKLELQLPEITINEHSTEGDLNRVKTAALISNCRQSIEGGLTTNLYTQAQEQYTKYLELKNLILQKEQEQKRSDINTIESQLHVGQMYKYPANRFYEGVVTKCLVITKITSQQVHTVSLCEDGSTVFHQWTKGAFAKKIQTKELLPDNG